MSTQTCSYTLSLTRCVPETELHSQRVDLEAGCVVLKHRGNVALCNTQKMIFSLRLYTVYWDVSIIITHTSKKPFTYLWEGVLGEDAQ